jgi:hypothetical protein
VHYRGQQQGLGRRSYSTATAQQELGLSSEFEFMLGDEKITAPNI